MKHQFAGITLDRYHLGNKVGAGGMGDVYQARDTRMLIGREVAIKVIELPEKAEEAKTGIELFEREISAITRLNHPHILSIFDYGLVPLFGLQVAFIVMPLLQYSLDGWLEQHRQTEPLSLQEISHFLFQAASALQEAHKHNIVHKDVKPQNFLIRNNVIHPRLPDLLLTDFGVAKLNTATYTIGNMPWGTPLYMPREQWEGKPVPASDQYALAVLAYKLLTQRYPYHGANPEEIRELHCNLDTTATPPSTIAATSPTTLDEVILKALSKKVEERYPSIMEFAEAFEMALKRTEQGAPIHLVLALNEAEAITGGDYVLHLPNGRETKITVPTNAQNGQELRKAGEGEKSLYGGLDGDLIVTLALKPNNETDQIMKELKRLSGKVDNLAPEVNIDEVLAQIMMIDEKMSVLHNQSQKATKQQAQAISELQMHLNSKQEAVQQSIQASHSIMKANMIALAATTTQNLCPPYAGNLVLEDLSGSKLKHDWTISPDNFYIPGLYMLNQKKQGYNISWLNHSNYTRYTYQVIMSIHAGSAGGIVFNYDEKNNGYIFLLLEDGKYVLLGIDSKDQAALAEIKNGYVSGWNRGYGEPNVITACIYSKSFDIYVNFQHVLNMKRVVVIPGNIGLVAYNEDTASRTEVGFSHAKVWTF